MSKEIDGFVHETPQERLARDAREIRLSAHIVTHGNPLKAASHIESVIESLRATAAWLRAGGQ